MFRKNYRRTKSTLLRRRPLGEILVEAGLLSSSQIEVALMDQQYNSQLLFGETLALRGWLRLDTADFFARDWHNVLNHRSNMPIGHYFKRAGLLDEVQVKAILREQQQTGVRFGTVAVLQGLLKERTLAYFLESLSPQESKKSPLKSRSLTYTRKIEPKPDRYTINMKELEDFDVDESLTHYVLPGDDIDLARSLRRSPKDIDDIQESVIWVG